MVVAVLLLFGGGVRRAPDQIRPDLVRWVGRRCGWWVLGAAVLLLRQAARVWVLATWVAADPFAVMGGRGGAAVVVGVLDEIRSDLSVAARWFPR